MDTNQQTMEDHVDESKPKAELEEYAEDGRLSEVVEFEKKEARLRRKLDWYIAPVMMMLMLISYLDRGNIGFAATQGMADDIGLKGNQLNVSDLVCDPPVSDLFTDGGVHLLHLLRAGRVPHVVLGQAASIPPCHPYHHPLLGAGLYVHGVCPELCRPLCLPTSAGVLRRVSWSATHSITRVSHLPQADVSFRP